jgi:hypothetical protein
MGWGGGGVEIVVVDGGLHFDEDVGVEVVVAGDFR